MVRVIRWCHGAGRSHIYPMTPAEKQQRDSVVAEAFSYRHPLLAYAFGSLGDHAAAEDAVQSAFLVVMDKYADFREGTSMLAWCRSIVRFKVFEILRQRKRLVTTEDGLLHDAIAFAFEDTQQEEQLSIRNDRLHRLRNCILRLPPKSRSLLEASMQPQSSYGKIAQSMTMNVEAVRKGLYRIRQTLRDCVAANLEPTV